VRGTRRSSRTAPLLKRRTAPLLLKRTAPLLLFRRGAVLEVCDWFPHPPIPAGPRRAEGWSLLAYDAKISGRPPPPLAGRVSAAVL